MKRLFILLFISVLFIPAIKAHAISTQIAEAHRDMNAAHGHHPNNINHNNNLHREGDAYGAGAAHGAAYGAAAGSANSSASANNGAVPVNPNAAEQNMLYYSGMKSMGQNK